MSSDSHYHSYTGNTSSKDRPILELKVWSYSTLFITASNYSDLDSSKL